MQLATPKSQDISKILPNIQTKYEKLCQKNEPWGTGQVLSPTDWGELHSGHHLVWWNQTLRPHFWSWDTPSRPWRLACSHEKSGQFAVQPWGHSGLIQHVDGAAQWVPSPAGFWAGTTLGREAVPDPGLQHLAEYQSSLTLRLPPATTWRKMGKTWVLMSWTYSISMQTIQRTNTCKVMDDKMVYHTTDTRVLRYWV